MPDSPPTDKPSVGKSENQRDWQSVSERLTAKIAVVSAPPAHLADFRFARDVGAVGGDRFRPGPMRIVGRTS
jgi:hypothetical protein